MRTRCMKDYISKLFLRVYAYGERWIIRSALRFLNFRLRVRYHTWITAIRLCGWLAFIFDCRIRQELFRADQLKWTSAILWQAVNGQLVDEKIERFFHFVRLPNFYFFPVLFYLFIYFFSSFPRNPQYCPQPSEIW